MTLTTCDRCSEPLDEHHEPIGELVLDGGAPGNILSDGVMLCFLCSEAVADEVKADASGPREIKRQSVGGITGEYK